MLKSTQDGATCPSQIYEVNEFNGGFSKFTETLSKKTELKIESFFELDDYLVKLYAEIIFLNDVARKTLVFNGRLN